MKYKKEKNCYDCQLYCDECGGNLHDKICKKFVEMSWYDKIAAEQMVDEMFYEGMSDFDIYVYDEMVKAELRENGYCVEDDESWEDD